MSREAYTPWDSAEFLDDDEAIMEYLRAALEENDLRFFMRAFDNAVRARDMNQKRIESSWSAPTLSTSDDMQERVINSGEEATVLMQGTVGLTGTQLNVGDHSPLSIPGLDASELGFLRAIEGK
jgi:hypothetical protein